MGKQTWFVTPLAMATAGLALAATPASAHCRCEGGMWGHWMGMMGGATPSVQVQRVMGPHIAYLFPSSSGNNYLLLGHARTFRRDNGFTIGHESNLAIQLDPSGGNGNWLALYGGVTPGYTAQFGNARLGVDVLLGPGAMVRSTSLGGAADVLEGRLLLEAQPEVKLGFMGDWWGASVVGGYLFTTAQSDLGGPLVGLEFGFEPHGW